MILPTKARPSLSYSQSLPSGSKNYNLQSPGKQTNNNNNNNKNTITGSHPKWSHGSQPCATQGSYEPCHAGPPKMNGSWWKVLTKHGLSEKGMTNPFSILDSRNPWTVQFSSVQSLSCVWLFVTPWIAARQDSLSITNTQSSLRLTSIESVMPSSHIILCRPLLLLLPIPPSIRVFSNESTLRMRWPKYWSFSFSNIPSKEIPGLIFFRMDRLDLLAVPGTLKSLLQHHSSKASILRCSRNPWTVWKGKKIWHQKMSPPGW